ncbi:hypothetical protein [Puia sp.]|jgi:hypothetical protein|uniref:hypothetical protein n=1 Tax=Puia sp. TaxID=2045100 RepID=UPI002F416501
MKQTLQYRILPYNRYSSFYQERESFYRSFINQYYLDFAHQVLSQDHQDPYLTKSLIAPHDIQFGANPRRVIWKIGMPSFQVKDINDFKDHKILFYRTKLLRQKVLIQFHFINNFFYYSQLSFLSFTEKTNDILFNSIKSKYECPNAMDNRERLVMTDICNNKLIIEKGVYLTVSYITGDTYPQSLMEHQLKQKHDMVHRADNYEIDKLSRIL